MESTSFLEELARSDDLSAGPQGPVANGSMMAPAVTMMNTGPTATAPAAAAVAAGGGMEMRQQVWPAGQMASGSMQYDYGPYGASRQQQMQMGQMSGYSGSAVNQNVGGTASNYPNMSAYSGYPSMQQPQQQQRVSMTPPRQLIAPNAAWNHSPGRMPSDPSAVQSYTGMAVQRGGMVQPHVGSQHGQHLQQMGLVVSRANGMPAQMYGQYVEFVGSSGQQVRMPGFTESQQQQQQQRLPQPQQEMSAVRGYGPLPSMSQMASPPMASSRLAQLSARASGAGSSSGGAQVPRVPGAIGTAGTSQIPRVPGAAGSGMTPYPHQSYLQAQGSQGSVDRASFMSDGQQVRVPGGMQAYQYVHGNAGVMSDGYGQYYAQPLYRMQGYPVMTQGYAPVTQTYVPATQSQMMMSPNAVAQLSPQSRIAAVRPPQHLQSPQSAAHLSAASQHSTLGQQSSPIVTTITTASASLQPNIPQQSNTVVPSGAMPRMMANDATRMGYGSVAGGMGPSPAVAGQSPVASGLSAVGSPPTVGGARLPVAGTGTETSNVMASSVMTSSPGGAATMMVMNNGVRYTMPAGYRMNQFTGQCNADMRQMYGTMSPQASLTDVRDSMRGFQPMTQQQNYYYQMNSQQLQLQQQHQQQSPMAAAVGGGAAAAGMSPDQTAQHPLMQSMSQASQQMLSPGRSLAAAVLPTNNLLATMDAPVAGTGPTNDSVSPGLCIQGTMQIPTEQLHVVSADDGKCSPALPTTSIPPSPPVLHLPDVRPPGPLSTGSCSPPLASLPSSRLISQDDEPLSTPPPLDVVDEAPRPFFGEQLPVSESGASSSDVAAAAAADSEILSAEPKKKKVPTATLR